MPLPPPPCRRHKGLGSTQRCRGPIALRAITREAAERSRGGVLRETASLPEQVASAGEVRPTSPPPHGAAATTAGSSCGLPAAISNHPGSQPDEQAATLGSGLLAERQGRGQGEASEAVVSGVEFKGIPRNFTVVTSNAFNAVFQKSRCMHRLHDEENVKSLKKKTGSNPAFAQLSLPLTDSPQSWPWFQ